MFPAKSHRQAFANIENHSTAFPRNSKNDHRVVKKASKQNKKVNRRLFDDSTPKQKSEPNASLRPSSRYLNNGVVHSAPKIFHVAPRSNYRVVIYEEKTTTPNEDFLERFEEVSSRYTFGTGYVDLRGAIQEGDSEWSDNLILDNVKFTEAQVRRIRVMIVPMERYAAMDEMGKLILGNEVHRRHRTFGPGYSYSVLRCYDSFRRLYSQISQIPQRFNMLFGFTFHLYSNPRWMTHHARGWGGGKMIAGLAKRWTDLLEHTAQQLGLDLEFSHPAMVYLLEDFQRKLEQVETYGDPRLHFEYK